MEMPRVKPLKTLFVETILFIGLFALMGHLSVTFWERYVIQTELSKMKTSLHTLKETINNIGVAYDHLHNELIHLAELAEKNPLKALTAANFRKVQDSRGINSLTSIEEKFVDEVVLEPLPDYEELGTYDYGSSGGRSVSTWSTHDKETQCRKRKTDQAHHTKLKVKNASITKGRNKHFSNSAAMTCPVKNHKKCFDTYYQEKQHKNFRF